MECIICFEPKTKQYKIKCGSTVAHEICHSCETTLRLQPKPNHHGRTIKCPVCRTKENGSGNRTRASYEAELRMLYSKLYPRILPFERPAVQFQQTPAPVRVRARAPRVPPAPVVPALVTPAPVAAPVAAPVTPAPVAAPVTPAPRAAPRAAPRVSVTAAAPASRLRDWCSNKHIQCPTKSKTTRKCTYPMGCDNKVCRHCNMCVSHFEF